MHVRKRIHHHKEPFPHPNKWVSRLDKYLLFVAIGGPFTLLPQILKIYREQNGESISIITFMLLCVMNGSWLSYGIVHKVKTMIVTNILLLTANSAIIIGGLLYGGGF
jgi:uncharacterized protein with PQ loop repeat